MKISVVVATYDRRDPLRALLESLFRQDLAPQEMEIVVVVDGSTDGTRQMLRDLRAPCALRTLFQDNAGQAAARNAGWHVARAPVVLFLDDDLECPPDLLAEHLAAHGPGDDRIVVGRVEFALPRRCSLAHDLLRGNMNEWERRLEQCPEMRWPEDAYVATNCSVARRLLEEVGGFDPAFYRALEDHDLGLRLWSRGGRFVYAPKAVVRQHYSKTTADAVRDEWWYGCAEVLLGRKHPDLLARTLVARVATLGWWQRRLLRAFAAFPAAATVLLGLPVRLMDRLDVPETIAAIGRRMAAVWMQANRLRAAVEASGGWRRFDATLTRRLSVLMYHHVGPSRPGTYPDLTVSPDAFARQISALAKRGYRGITPGEYLQARRGEIVLPKRALIVTFDDGYADIAEYAFPVLARHGFGCVVFIVTDELAGTNSWDEARGSATHRLLSREQILDWQARGVEFGGHSRTHASLPTLGLQQLREEINGCRADMERLTGSSPQAFAYPYGDYDSRAVAEARAAYALAFTTVEGTNCLGTDPHLLRRTMVMPGDSGGTVLLRARLGLSPWDVLRRWRAGALAPVRRAVDALLRNQTGTA